MDLPSSSAAPEFAGLQLELERLRRVLRSTTEGWWDWELQTGVVHYSERWWEMLGYPPDATASDLTRWQELCHPEDLLLTEKLVAGLADHSGELLETEFRLRHADGTYRTHHVRALIERDAHGQPVRLSGINEDVSERQRVENALRESEQHMRVLFETMISGFSLHEVICDSSGVPCDYRFLEVNPAFERLTGLRRADLIGRRVLEVLPNTEVYWIERFGRVALTGQIDRFENFSRELGRHYEVSCYSPKPGQFAVLTFDVTERIQQEENARKRETAFFRLIENASDMITIVDLQGQIIYQSPSIERLLGYPAQQIAGQKIDYLIHPEDAVRAMARLSQAFLQPGLTLEGEYRLRHRDGRWRRFGVTGMAITGESQIVVNSRDVTEQRELEEKLLQSQKMEAIGQLSGGIAHDFNNLLTAIKGYCGLLGFNPRLPPEDREYIRRLDEAVNRAVRLTQQLLAFSRRQTVALQPLELNQVVGQMSELLRRVLGEQIEITLDLGGGQLPLLGDQGLLEQVILNLAINARDAMPASGKLVIATRLEPSGANAAGRSPRELPAGEQIRLTVTDNGCGINPEILPRIFEPFFTTKESGKGTGLGLATVHGIVHQHGGTIEVTSTPGQGTVFTLLFPKAQALAPAAVPGGPALEQPLSGSETLLVAEDEPAVRDLVNLLLNRMGYRVLMASDGYSAMTLWREHRREIKLLLTDVVMPGGLSGHELANRIRQDDSRLPIIFMTGYDPENPAGEGRTLAGTQLIKKPFDNNQLGIIVRQVLDARRAGELPGS